MKDVTKTFVGKNKMITKAQAQLELIKLDRNIEKKVVEYSNELGQYNKSIVMDELQLLWDKKDINLPEDSPACPVALPILFPNVRAKPPANGIIKIANNASCQF